MDDVTTGDLGLDPGETAAILLAEHLGAAALLIDERKGRAVAASRGLADDLSTTFVDRIG